MTTRQLLTNYAHALITRVQKDCVEAMARTNTALETAMKISPCAALEVIAAFGPRMNQFEAAVNATEAVLSSANEIELAWNMNVMHHELNLLDEMLRAGVQSIYTQDAFAKAASPKGGWATCSTGSGEPA